MIHKLEIMLQLKGGTVASWLVCWSLDQAVPTQTLNRDILLCSWARHYKTCAVQVRVQYGSPPMCTNGYQ